MCSNWRSKTSQSTGSLLFDLSCQDPHVELEILEEIAVDCAVLFCSDFASWSVTSFRDFEKWHRPGFTFTTSHPTFYLTSYQAWNLSYYIRKKSCGSQSQWRDGLCFIMGSPSILLPGSVRLWGVSVLGECESGVSQLIIGVGESVETVVFPVFQFYWVIVGRGNRLPAGNWQLTKFR